MYRSRLWMRTATLVAVVSTLLAGLAVIRQSTPAFAAATQTVGYSDTINGTSGADVATPLDIPQFDPELGRLDSVVVTGSASFGYAFQLENTANFAISAASMTGSHRSGAVLRYPAAVNGQTMVIGGQDLAAFDGVFDFGGPSGRTFSDFVTMPLNRTYIAGDPGFGSWVGGGAAVPGLTCTTHLTDTHAAPAVVQYGARDHSASCSVSVTYHYVRQCDGKDVTIDLNLNGGNGNGTSAADVMLGRPLADTLLGAAGTDSLCADSNDRAGRGGPGNDRIFVEPQLGATVDQAFTGDGGNDLVSIRAGSSIAGVVAGDGHLGGNGGNDTIRVAGFMQGPVRGDDVAGNGGDDVISIFPAGFVETIVGDFASGDGGNDTITLVGQAAAVRGDGVSGFGGNDLIAVTNGALLTPRNPAIVAEGWLTGDTATAGGGDDFFIVRGRIDGGIMGDDTAGDGGRDFMRIYPAAVIDGPVIGDGGGAASNGVFGRAGGSGGHDTVVAWAGATITGQIYGDASTGRGGNDNFSLGATISGSVIGDLVTGGGGSGNGGLDSIGIGGNGWIGGDVIGDWVSGRGGPDLFDISGRVVGTVYGDRADGDGGDDLIYIRPIGRVGRIVGDDVDGRGGDDRIIVNNGAIVDGSIVADQSFLRGGNDHITVSGRVDGSIFLDDPTGLGGNDRIVVNPAGVVNGDIDASKGTNAIIIRGTVNGSIFCSQFSRLRVIGGTVNGSTRGCIRATTP